MFSPVTAITAGALALAIGGVLLLVQPFDQSPEVVPAVSSETAATEILFAIVEEPNSGVGEFTGYGSIPKGTTSREQGMWEPPDFAFTITIDPGDPGGDTFAIQHSGRIQVELKDDVVQGKSFWSVVNGSGTGEYANITGKGRVIAVAHADNDMDRTDDWGVAVFVGHLGPAPE